MTNEKVKIWVLDRSGMTEPRAVSVTPKAISANSEGVEWVSGYAIGRALRSSFRCYRTRDAAFNALLQEAEAECFPLRKELAKAERRLSLISKKASVQPVTPEAV